MSNIIVELKIYYKFGLIKFKRFFINLKDILQNYTRKKPIESII